MIRGWPADCERTSLGSCPFIASTEITMIPKTMWFPAGVAKLALGSLLALATTAGTAHAQPTTLTCGQTGHTPGSTSQTTMLRIDFATGLVEELGPSGTPTNRIAPSARVSSKSIRWSARLLDTGVQMIWEGAVDRLSGKGWIKVSREPDWRPYRTSVACR